MVSWPAHQLGCYGNQQTGFQRPCPWRGWWLLFWYLWTALHLFLHYLFSKLLSNELLITCSPSLLGFDATLAPTSLSAVVSVWCVVLTSLIGCRGLWEPQTSMRRPELCCVTLTTGAIKISTLPTLWGVLKIYKALDVKIIWKCLVHYIHLNGAQKFNVSIFT